MRYVVLGVTGFIGCVIDSFLREQTGVEVISPTHSQCDLLNSKHVSEILCPLTNSTTVIYAAGIPRLRGDSFSDLTANLTMVQNVLQAARESPPARIVFLSSVEVYGTPDHLPLSEQSDIHPERLYAVGKFSAELLLGQWHRTTGVPVAVLRLPGVYGPNDRGLGFVGTLLRTIREQGEFTLLGEGDELRDFVYAEDVARTIHALSEVEFRNLTVNLATGNSLPLAKILRDAFVLLGGCRVRSIPRKQPICHLQFDTSLLRRTLPSLVMTSLQEGLRRCVAE